MSSTSPQVVEWRKRFEAADPTQWKVNPSDANRFDLLGTTNGNELVRHLALPTAGKTSALRSKNNQPQGKKIATSTDSKTDAVVAEDAKDLKLPEGVDKFSYNFSKHFVHPLHNFLQLKFGLTNADELQLMVMPPKATAASTAAIAAAAAASSGETGPLYAGKTAGQKKRANKGAGRNRGGGASPSSTTTPKAGAAGLGMRDVYLATNFDSVTQDQVDKAIEGWKVPSVYHIQSITVVTGNTVVAAAASSKTDEGAKKKANSKKVDSEAAAAPEPGADEENAKVMSSPPAVGRHAEQKLLEFLMSAEMRAKYPDLFNPKLQKLGLVQKALIIGERLPCVACKLFSLRYSKVATLLPSHGHMYLSTIPYTPERLFPVEKDHPNPKSIYRRLVEEFEDGVGVLRKEIATASGNNGQQKATTKKETGKPAVPEGTTTAGSTGKVASNTNATKTSQAGAAASVDKKQKYKAWKEKREAKKKSSDVSVKADDKKPLSSKEARKARRLKALKGDGFDIYVEMSKNRPAASSKRAREDDDE